MQEFSTLHREPHPLERPPCSADIWHFRRVTGSLQGLPWVGPEGRRLKPSALQSKILCDRHNRALSKLDDLSTRVFRSFDDTAAVPGGRVHFFSGFDIGRWMLKILCGLMASKSIGEEPALQQIPLAWQRILFGESEFEKDLGLYVCRSIGHAFEGPHGVKIEAIGKPDKSLSGIGLSLCGTELVLSMTGFPSREFDGRTFAYRPLELLTRGANFERSVAFDWQEAPADAGTLVLTSLHVAV
jgi:hypothetical protein